MSGTMPSCASTASQAVTDDRSQPTQPGGVGTGSSATQVVLLRLGVAVAVGGPATVAASNIAAAAAARVTSHANEQAMAEVRFQVGAEDLLRGRFDVVVDALELELLLVGVEQRVAGAGIVVARLSHRADADDVLPARAQLEAIGDDLVNTIGRQCERLAQMGMPDQRQR